MKIVFFGTPDFVLPVVERLDEKFELVAIVTTPNSPLIASFNTKLKVFSVETLDEDLERELSYLEPDLFVVASFGKILPQSLIDIPTHGTINIHFSLLPKYRGASPMQQAILNGDKVTGISILKMDEKLDHGPIIYQEDYNLSEQDNFQTLRINMFQRTSEIICSVIQDYIDGKIKPKEQNHDQATYCKIIKKEDGFFDIKTPPAPDVLDRMIRAYFPWPTAWTIWRLKNKRSLRSDDLKELRIKLLPGNMVQMEGKKAVSLKEFLNGHPNFPLVGLINNHK